MLILTRKKGDAIAIGDRIRVQILSVKGKQVRIGVEAPRDLQVDREESDPQIEESFTQLP
jgi:carbon storage regulator